MKASSLRWGVSYSALLWALAVCAPQPAVAAPQETVLYSFTGGPDGANPLSELLIEQSGVLIGTTSQGGDLSGCGGKGCGVVFELTPPTPGSNRWKETVVYRFQGGADGSAPTAGVLQDKTGALYGVTSEGGDGPCYSYKRSGTYPGSSWKRAARIGCGMIFKLTPPAVGHSLWAETILHAFAGKDGRSPAGIPLMDKTGALYGATAEGGGGPCHSYWSYAYSADVLAANYHWKKGAQVGCGTIFKLTPPTNGHPVWTEEVLFAFHAKDGRLAAGISLMDKTGALYGVTSEGGVVSSEGGEGPCGLGNLRRVSAFPSLSFTPKYRTGCGTVFKLTPPAAGQNAWTLTTLQVFNGRNSGIFPVGRVISAADGSLLGATHGGVLPATHGQTKFNIGARIFPPYGAFPQETVFELTPPVGQAVAPVHAFVNSEDGAFPAAGLIRNAVTGGFYGVTAAGGGIGCGSNGCGTVFSLKPPGAGRTNWTEAVLHRFGSVNDGRNPQARLAIDKAGNLYGTTQGGGVHLYGTVFEVSP